MIVYKNYTTYKVLNVNINLISDQTDYGIHTVAEINDKYFYLGPQTDNILAAVFAWELFSGRTISDEEFAQSLDDNEIDLVLLDPDNKTDNE